MTEDFHTELHGTLERKNMEDEYGVDRDKVGKEKIAVEGKIRDTI